MDILWFGLLLAAVFLGYASSTAAGLMLLAAVLIFLGALAWASLLGFLLFIMIAAVLITIIAADNGETGMTGFCGIALIGTTGLFLDRYLMP